MPYITLDEDDVTNAMREMQRAGVLETVLSELTPSGFTMLEFLSDQRTPKRLVSTRKSIWRRVYATRDEHGQRVWSSPELGRLFNRDHTTILHATRGT